MSITATVENGMIRLPAGVHVPDGTKAEIVFSSEEAKEAEGISTQPAEAGRFGWIQEFAGCIDTLPEDAADRHDALAHGRKRRLE
jgi:hypothetical protein